MRITLGENASGKTKITVPTRKHADLLKNVTGNAQEYYMNQANAKPYGRWIKLRLNFDGVDQVYIESVISETTIRYS